MKKVIFLAIAAAAALTACSKSEVIDSKYGNDMIGFETYLGRDAQTKASVADLTALKAETYNGIGLYGFYTGKEDWGNSTTANLWANEKLSWGTINTEEGTSNAWVYTNTKYWTNEYDKYTFLAYAPYNHSTLTVSTGDNVKDPTVAYSVPTELADQIDLLYANDKVNTTKKANASGVGLQLKHALSRITVKASENIEEYGYTIKAISLTGVFNSKGTLKLSDNSWTVEDADKKEQAYEFLKNTETAVVVPTPKAAEGETPAVTAYDFAGTDNYLMIIPADFSGENAEATLSITYSTTFDGHESTDMTKTLPVKAKFEQGNAYALNLVFEPNEDNAITFTVDVAPWTETTVEVGNPEEGETVTPAPGA